MCYLENIQSNFQERFLHYRNELEQKIGSAQRILPNISYIRCLMHTASTLEQEQISFNQEIDL